MGFKNNHMHQSAMRGTGASAAVVLLFVLGLSGCIGGSAGSSGVEAKVDVDASFSEDTGAIRGIVTSTELQPLAGARVTILELSREANTSEAGVFAFSEIPPGDYKLVVEALGYTSIARALSVLVGQITELNVALEVLPILEPYVELLIFRGFAVCDINAVFIILQTPSAVPGCNQLKGQFPVDVKETWRYGIFEAAWRSVDSLHFFADTDGTCLFGTSSSNPCYEWKTGRSPLRLDAVPNATWHLAPPSFRYPTGAFKLILNGGGAGLLQKEISDSQVCKTGRPNGPECGGVGYNVFGFAYTVYVSIFHHEAPSDPKTYSAIPDS